MRRHAKAIVAISALLLTLALGATIASAVAPSVTVENAEDVSYTSAKVKGAVDPQGQSTTYRFQYATQAQFEAEGFASATTGVESSLEGTGPQTVEGELTPLAPGTTYHLRLVAENGDGQGEAIAASAFATEAVAAPAVSIDPVTTFTGTTAHFSGTINPNAPEATPASAAVEAGFKVSWRFECTPSCPGLKSSQALPADSAGHVVSDDATGLEPNTDYQVSLVAENAGGLISAGPQSFGTEALAPAVIDLPVGPITETTAVLGGKIDPNNAPTTYHLEYSTHADFSASISIPASQDANVGSGGSLVSVSRLATGLSPDTDYFYRLAADNPTGPPTISASHGFRTLALAAAGPVCPNATMRTGLSANLPDCRAYEMVSPPAKRGGSAGVHVATLDNNHIYYSATVPLLSGEPSFTGISRYLSTRSSAGWDLSPATYGPLSFAADFSTDYAQRVITGNSRLTPADTDSTVDVYAETAAGIRLVSEGSIGGSSFDQARYVGESADGSHILFETAEHLEPADAARISGTQLYERVGNQLQVVGLDSNETLTSNTGAVLGWGQDSSIVGNGIKNAVSTDGSHIFFTSPDPQADPDDPQLYARLNGTDTVEISASRCDRISPSCEDAGFAAVFQGASSDGSIAFFSSLGQLTNDDQNQANDLFRYEFSNHRLTRISDVPFGTVECANISSGGQAPGVCGVVAVAEDGRRIYYSVGASKDSGSDSRRAALFLYDDRTETNELVTETEEAAGSKWIQQGREPTPSTVATPNGATLVFETREQLTAFDNSIGCSKVGEPAVSSQPCTELYLFRAGSGIIECLSCNRTGAPPLENKAAAQNGSSASMHKLRFNSPFADIFSPAFDTKSNTMISDDGEVIALETADSLLPQDVNGRSDVYEWRGGHIALLSLGTEAHDSTLAGVTADGRSIAFTTESQLLPQDVDFQRDIYLAREGGGFPPHAAATPPCFGEGCRGQVSTPPAAVSSGSNAFSGPGNARAGKSRCAKAHYRRRGRCVKKHARKHHKSTQHGKRANTTFGGKK